MDIAAPEIEHDMARGLQQIVDALLLSHHAHVADEVAAAALEPRVGRQDFQALETRSAAYDEHPLGRHAAALDGDSSVRLVGGDRYVGGAESPVLERQQQAMEKATPAKLRFEELGVEIVVIENEFLSDELEESTDQEEQIGRVAGVNDVETACKQHPPGEHKGPGECDRVLHRITRGARCFDGQVVAVDVNPVDRLEFLLAALASRAHDRHEITGVAQRTRLLPDAAVEGAGEIFDQEQYASRPTHARLRVGFTHYQQIPS